MKHDIWRRNPDGTTTLIFTEDLPDVDNYPDKTTLKQQFQIAINELNNMQTITTQAEALKAIKILALIEKRHLLYHRYELNL